MRHKHQGWVACLMAGTTSHLQRLPDKAADGLLVAAERINQHDALMLQC